MKNNTKNIRKGIIAILFTVMMVASVFTAMCTPVSAATEDDIEQAIVNGTAWLADQQDPASGAWSLDYYPVASTAFAVLKFEHHAKYTLDLDPFDPAYEYSENIVKGLNYIFNHSHNISIGPQTHCNPEAGQVSPNGNGIYFVSTTVSKRPLYETGIVMMALEASGNGTREVEYGEHAGLTYQAVMQDLVDYLAWAQQDSGLSRGGWRYCPFDNGTVVCPPGGLALGGADNSVSQWPALGLVSAANWSIFAPACVTTELEDHWLVYSQNANGGFGYASSSGPRVDMTAAGMIELTYCGVTTNDARWANAREWICENWGSGNIGDLYAMYGVMKASMIAQPEEIWWYNCSIGNHSWQEEYDTWLIANQHDDGYWTGPYGTTGARKVLGTEWALLILQKVAPPPLVIKIPVDVDIKPGSCPNPLNLKSKGVLPVAVLGTEDFDVTTIDPETIRLNRSCDGCVGVAPIRWAYEDVATPFEGELCDCHNLTNDSYMDLTLKFDTQDLVTALELVRGEGNVTLTLTGNLKEEEGGTPIEGKDCIFVL